MIESLVVNACDIMFCTLQFTYTFIKKDLSENSHGEDEVIDFPQEEDDVSK
jgi:hypothetical protein